MSVEDAIAPEESKRLITEPQFQYIPGGNAPVTKSGRKISRPTPFVPSVRPTSAF